MIKGVKDHIKRISKFSRHVCIKLSQNSKKKILSEGVKENEVNNKNNVIILIFVKPVSGSP